MAASDIPYEPDQDFLLPPSMREWLPEGHLALFISDTVDALDLTAFRARYDKGGARKQPFHPAMMVKVMLYGYAVGCQLAQGRNEATRVLADQKKELGT
jgi:transposase